MFELLGHPRRHDRVDDVHLVVDRVGNFALALSGQMAHNHESLVGEGTVPPRE